MDDRERSGCRATPRRSWLTSFSGDRSHDSSECAGRLEMADERNPTTALEAPCRRVCLGVRGVGRHRSCALAHAGGSPAEPPLKAAFRFALRPRLATRGVRSVITERLSGAGRRAHPDDLRAGIRRRAWPPRAPHRPRCACRAQAAGFPNPPDHAEQLPKILPLWRSRRFWCTREPPHRSRATTR